MGEESKPLEMVRQLTNLQVAYLATLYAQQPLPADELPYTPELRQMHATILGRFPEPAFDEGDLFRMTVALRKRGVLASKPRESRQDARAPAPAGHPA